MAITGRNQIASGSDLACLLGMFLVLLACQVRLSYRGHGRFGSLLFVGFALGSDTIPGPVCPDYKTNLKKKKEKNLNEVVVVVASLSRL